MAGPTGVDVGTSGLGFIGNLFGLKGGAATADASGVVADINADVLANKQITNDATQERVQAMLSEARIAEARTEAVNTVSPGSYDLGSPAEKLG